MHYILCTVLFCNTVTGAVYDTPKNTAVTVTTLSEFNRAVKSNITINLAADIILTATIKINNIHDLVINGNEFKVNGNTKYGCFNLVESQVAFINIFIVNGKATNGGGIYMEKVVASMINCTVSNNVVTASGGGLYINIGSTLSMANCIVANNIAISYGNGIYVLADSMVHMTDCFVMDNTGNGKGGVCVVSSNLYMLNCDVESSKATTGGFYIQSSTVTLQEVTVARHTASGGAVTNGGGLYVTMGSILTMRSCTIAGNTAKYNAGGIYLISGSTALFKNCMIAGNTAGAFGGGIYVTESSAILSNCGIVKNQAQSGGGLYLLDNSELISARSCNISENTAILSDAGGIFATASDINFTSCIVSSNSAKLGSGGMYFDCSASAAMSSCVISRNGGYGIFTLGGLVQSWNMIYELNGESNSIGGASAAAVQCFSLCTAGEFGNCTSVTGSPQCFVNCQCTACIAGTSSSIMYSTSTADCVTCGSGSYSEPRSIQCTICEVGRFATDIATNNGGGLIDPTASGATQCNPCPAGMFSATQSTIVCQTCPEGSTSRSGTTTCILASPGWYVDPSVEYVEYSHVLRCPTQATCIGDNYLPLPATNNWVDRKSPEFASKIYPCSRATCGGAKHLNATELSCWEATSYGNDDCSSDTIQCNEGAAGPLCGYCLEGFVYNALTRTCSACAHAQTSGFVLFGVLLGCVVIAIALQTGAVSVPLSLQDSWLLGVMRELNKTGVSRVLVATYGIVQSVSWNVGTGLPSPFSVLVSILSIFSLDFISLACLSTGILKLPKFDMEVILTASLPIFLGAMIGIAYLVRLARVKNQSDRSNMDTVQTIGRSHANAVLVLGFFVWPSVNQRLFQALDCVVIHDISYLRVDTSVNCGSKTYKLFAIATGLFIAAYMTMPFIWGALLYRARTNLNPPIGDDTIVRYLVSQNQDIQPLSFLFNPYRPKYFYFEVIISFWRIFFIGMIAFYFYD